MARILKKHKKMAERYKAVYDELYEELPLWKKQAVQEDHERITTELVREVARKVEHPPEKPEEGLSEEEYPDL